MKKIEDLLSEYHLSRFQNVACMKFIKDKVGNPNCDSVKRLRDWLFMRLNGKKLPEVYHKRQLGCPDLVPGMTVKPLWDVS